MLKAKLVADHLHIARSAIPAIRVRTIKGLDPPLALFRDLILRTPHQEHRLPLWFDPNLLVPCEPRRLLRSNALLEIQAQVAVAVLLDPLFSRKIQGPAGRLLQLPFSVLQIALQIIATVGLHLAH